MDTNKKNNKTKKNNKFLIISLILILLTLISVILSFYLIDKKQKEIEEAKRLEELNRKYPISSEDFEEGLLNDYTLLGCDIEKDCLTFYINNVNSEDYSKLCKNLNSMMKEFKDTKENCSQTKAKFYIYNNNISNYKKEKEKILIEYEMNENYYQTTELQDIPIVENSEGLLAYEFISFDGKTLEVSMDLFSLTLYEKIGQMKTFYEVAKSMNENIIDLNLKIIDNNTTYIYNDTNIITIINKVNL